MQQGYIVLHNYPNLSLILVIKKKYIIIDSHTKREIFQTYGVFFSFFLHIWNSISKAA